MNIEGTVFEIIAKANGFKKIHKNLYADKDNNKYQATQYGFIPNEIYNAEMLVRQHKIETDKLQAET